MKKTTLTLQIILVFQICFSQSIKKTIFGSFVFKEQVFQYQYTRDEGIHSLKLSTLAKPEPLFNLDENKLDKTVEFIKKATDASIIEKNKNKNEYLSNASKEILDTIAQLKNYIEQIKNIYKTKSIWKENNSGIDNQIEILNKIKIENILIDDTLTTGIYNPLDLLFMYKGFLQNITEPTASQEIPFPELKILEFQNIFKQEIFQILNKEGFQDEKSNQVLETTGTNIFYEIKSRIEFKDDEPITAYIVLKRKYITIDIHLTTEIKRNNKTLDTLKMIKKIPFEVTKVIVEFEDGGIKNIFADLLPQIPEYKNIYGNNTIRFRNLKPISIIGKFDPDEFARQKISAGNISDLISVINTASIPKDVISLRQLCDTKPNKCCNENFHEKCIKMHPPYFYLSNIIDYIVESENDNEDYSPTNSKIELTELGSRKALKKEKRSNILTVRAFSDFMGISDDQPNGLVQIEASKKINIISGRHSGVGLGFCTIGINNQKGIYSGGLTFIEPKFTISKIEENNRYLILDSTHLDKDKSKEKNENYFLLNPIDVLRYQQWSFGIDVNLYKLSIHNRKSNFQINGNLNFGRTSTADSILVSDNEISPTQYQNISKISTINYGLGILYEIKPDSRYGFSFGYDFQWIDMLNNNFEYAKGFTNYYHRAWFTGFIKLNDTSKLFWRFRKNWLANNNKYNYYQIQIGYELDLFKTNK